MLSVKKWKAEVRIDYSIDQYSSYISEMFKLSATKNHFLNSMIKNGFKQIYPVDFKEEHPTSDLIEWRYMIT